MVSGDAEALRHGCSVLSTQFLGDEKVIAQRLIRFTVVSESLVMDLEPSLEVLTLRHLREVSCSV